MLPVALCCFFFVLIDVGAAIAFGYAEQSVKCNQAAVPQRIPSYLHTLAVGIDFQFWVIVRLLYDLLRVGTYLRASSMGSFFSMGIKMNYFV